jgi:hypothetical protein
VQTEMAGRHAASDDCWLWFLWFGEVGMRFVEVEVGVMEVRWSCESEAGVEGEVDGGVDVGEARWKAS